SSLRNPPTASFILHFSFRFHSRQEFTQLLLSPRKPSRDESEHHRNPLKRHCSTIGQHSNHKLLDNHPFSFLFVGDLLFSLRYSNPTVGRGAGFELLKGFNYGVDAAATLFEDILALPELNCFLN